MTILKRLNFILLSFFLMASCAKEGQIKLTNVDEPANVLLQDSLDKYPPLLSYIDSIRMSSPIFRLGAGVTLGSYVQQGAYYYLINNNFDQMTLGYAMKYGAVVQNDGTLNLINVNKLIDLATQAGVRVYGHTLVWNANQNATYLNSLIAPTITGISSWNSYAEQNFESNNSSNYSTSNATMAFTSVGGGFNGEGRALKVTNDQVRANDYQSQLFFNLPGTVKSGEQYKLTMDIKADAPASASTQAQTAPGQYKFYDFFGTVSFTKNWTTFSKVITVSNDQAGSGTIAFDLGLTATTYYFDNIKIEKYNNGTIEKTPQEKDSIISNAMKTWIAQMMAATPSVHCWDVVNEPISDGPPYGVKTGVGKTLSSDEFFWQDYMGKDYAVKAFEWARKYGGGDDTLFINDYGLESNLDKCRGLINYVKYIDSSGAKVDGIGTQMHIDINTNRQTIKEMFQLLAATGKLIRISELDIGLGNGITTDQATDSLYKLQSGLYKYVVEEYFKIIPKDQRFGITFWSPLDSPQGSSWRPGEPIGLWTLDYKRKMAYAGVAEALSIQIDH